jgi:hypothetical protein
LGSFPIVSAAVADFGRPAPLTVAITMAAEKSLRLQQDDNDDDDDDDDDDMDHTKASTN